METGPFEREPYSGPSPPKSSLLALRGASLSAGTRTRAGEPATLQGLTFSLCCRWADNFKARGCGESEEHSFQHPFLQVSARPSPLPICQASGQVPQEALLFPDQERDGVLSRFQKSHPLLSPFPEHRPGCKCLWKRAEGTVLSGKPE